VQRLIGASGLLIAFLVLAAGVAACGSSSSDSGAAQVGVILKSQQNDYWRLAKSGVDSATENLGETADVSFAAGTDQNEATEEISEVENMLTKGVEGIAIAPSGTDQLTPILEKAAGEGVPVVLIDTEQPGLKEKTFVGSNNVEGGEIAGSELVKVLSGKTGKVVLLTGLPGTSSLDERETGFRQALEASGAKIEATGQTECDPAKAKGIAENALTSDPEVVGFFSPCGGILEQVIPVAEMAVGQARAREMAMVEFDFAMSLQGKILESGMLDATIAQYPQEMAEKATELAAEAADGKAIPKKVDTKLEVVTPSNYQNYAKEFNAALASLNG